MKQPTQEELMLQAEALLEPIEFFRKGEIKPCLWGCAICGAVATHRADAIQCYTCYPRLCKTEGCGTRLQPRNGLTCCDPCHEVHKRERLAAKIQKAPNKVLFKDYEGEYFITEGGKYCSELEELEYDGIDDTYPRFVFGCKPVRFQLDFDQAMADALERVEVEGEFQLFPTAGEQDLKAAFKAFNDGQPAVGWYEEDTSTVIFLDWPDPKELDLEPDEVRDDWPARWDAQAVLEGREPLF